MEKSKFRFPARFWTEERNLTWLLAALILDTFILNPLVSVFTTEKAVATMNSLVFVAILVFGLFTLTRHKVIQIALTVIIALVTAVRFTRLVFGGNGLLVWEIVLSMMSLVAFLVILLINVYQGRPVTRHRIRGAVGAYLLIAIIFAFGYFLIDFLIPGAFHFPVTVPRNIDTQLMGTFYYFSISTLTTLGYGDIIPAHPFARTLAMSEALVGQLYPVLLIARLVTLHTSTGRTSGS